MLCTALKHKEPGVEKKQRSVCMEQGKLEKRHKMKGQDQGSCVKSLDFILCPRGTHLRAFNRDS